MYERTVVHHETLPGDSLPTEFYAFLHTDPERLLKELLDSPQVKFDVYPMRLANVLLCKLLLVSLCKRHFQPACCAGSWHVLRFTACL